MICTNCGYNLNDSASFCPNCGNKVELINSTQNIGRLTIKRESTFVGCAIFYDILINNQKAGVIGNGESLQYNLSFGTYEITIHPTLSASTKQVITLTPQQPNITIFITHGFIKPKITNIQCI